MSQGYMSGDWNYFYVASGQARDMLRVERSDRSVRWTVLRREQGLDPLGTPPLLDSDRAVAVAARKGMPTDRLERLILDQDNPPRRMVWTFESKAGRYRVDARTGQFLP